MKALFGEVLVPWASPPSGSRQKRRECNPFWSLRYISALHSGRRALGGRSGRAPIAWRGNAGRPNRGALGIGLGHTARVRTLATFRLSGPPGATSGAVTDRLRISPSRSHEMGEPVGRLGGTQTHSAWLLESAPGPQDDIELADQLRGLLTRLEPVTAALWELVGEGYWANWFCYLGSRSTEHAAELDREILQRLLVLPGDLWIDLHPQGEDEG
jgi:hypothetical protein